MAVSRIVGEIEEKVTVREIGGVSKFLFFYLAIIGNLITIFISNMIILIRGEHVLFLLTLNHAIFVINIYVLVLGGDHNLDHHDN